MTNPINLPPVWLLDFDGVINAISNKPPRHVWDKEEWRTGVASDGAGHEWKILAANPVLNFIRTTHETGLAEIRWLTTWQDKGNTTLAPLLDLPTFPVMGKTEYNQHMSTDIPLGYGSSPNITGWWKLRSAVTVLENEGRRLVWTDDDIRHENFGRRLQPVPQYVAMGKALLVSPQTSLGLSRKQLTEIETFLTA